MKGRTRPLRRLDFLSIFKLTELDFSLDTAQRRCSAKIGGLFWSREVSLTLWNKLANIIIIWSSAQSKLVSITSYLVAVMITWRIEANFRLFPGQCCAALISAPQIHSGNFWAMTQLTIGLLFNEYGLKELLWICDCMFTLDIKVLRSPEARPLPSSPKDTLLSDRCIRPCEPTATTSWFPLWTAFHLLGLGSFSVLPAISAC